MRHLFVAFVTVLALVLLTLPAQAGEVSPCSDCDTTVNTAPVLSQCETEESQPIGDHTWGGDPDADPAYEGWVHWWWYVMNVLCFYSCD